MTASIYWGFGWSHWRPGKHVESAMFGCRIVPWIVGGTLLCSGSLVGLLAIWVALGRPHWFLRVAAWAGVVLSLLLIPAFEPVLLFSIQTLVAVVPLAVGRGWLASRRDGAAHGEAGAKPTAGWRPQFQLRDLLLLTLLVAVAAAVVGAAPDGMGEFWNSARGGRYSRSIFHFRTLTSAEGWAVFRLLGFAMGLSTVVAAWVGLSRRRRWLRLVGLLLVPTSALMAVWLGFLRVAGWPSEGQNGPVRSFGRHVARIGSGLLTLVILVPPVATFLILVSPAPQPPKTVLPNPNGYDDLQRAAKAWAPEAERPLSWAWSMSQDERLARDRVEAEVLDSIRIGLSRPCVVPLEYTMKDTGRSSGMLSLLGVLRALPGDDATACSIERFRLAQAVSRGGMERDWWVGLAIEGLVFEDMAELRKHLDSQRCREIIDALRQIEADREPVDVFADRDALWERVALGNSVWVKRWLSIIERSTMDWRSYYIEREGCSQAQRRMLLCGLALEAYRLDHGELPGTLSDLVPEYLPELPLDPFSGKPLVFRAGDGEYVLYSVGPDRVDNGGNARAWLEYSGETPGSDILLDGPRAGFEYRDVEDK